MVADTIAALREYFAGRSDVYALGRVDPATNKARYFTQNEPLTDEVLVRHLLGDALVGVYPMVEGSKVKWFALDIDHPKDDEGNVLPDPFPQAWKDALAQADALSRAGLHVYLERSRSGEGVHIWGFFSDWVDGATVRRAIKPLLLDSDTLDRMYPLQDELTPTKPYGNLIALPFHGEAVERGNSMFMDRQSCKEILIADFVQSIRTNTPSVIELLAEKAPKQLPMQNARKLPVVQIGADGGRPARPLAGILKLVSPYGCDFMRKAYDQRKSLSEPAWYAAIGQLTCFEQGRDAAHVFSMGHPHYNQAEVDAKYDHAFANPPVGCAYIHEHFPKLACKTCPMLAPYRRAERRLSEMLQDGGTELATGGFAKHLPKVRALDSGEEDSGILWGFPGLDQYTRFRPSELTVIGAQVSMGKTALMVHVSANVAKGGDIARVFSAEMGEEELRARYLAHFAGVDSRAIRGERSAKLTKDEWRRLEEAAALLDSLPIEFNFTANQPETMLLACERSTLRQRQPLEKRYVSFFDYMQFAAKQGSETPYERISRHSKESKLFAKVSRNAHCALSQVTRDTEGEESPDVTWFKGCLAGATLITRADTGEQVPIAELARQGATNVPVYAVKTDGKITTATLTHAFSNGVRPVYDLRLASGRVIRATGNHPFKTLFGWTALDDLKLADRIAIPRLLPAPAKYATVLADESLMELATSDVFWDRIVAIEPAGTEEVFDAEVPGLNNFVANGILVHNSGDIEADLDVGIVLTGARVEGITAPRAATIVKQRNGMANVRAEYLFDMSTSTFEPVRVYDTGERPPLFGEGELGFGDDGT